MINFRFAVFGSVLAFTLCISSLPAFAQGKGVAGDATVTGVVNGSATAISKGIGTTASNEVGFIDKDAKVGSGATVTGVVDGNTTTVKKSFFGGEKKTRVGGIVAE